MLALVLVGTVGALFVGGTKAPTEVVEAPAPPARPAGERRAPSSVRTWQDRYRAEHPELLVGSPDVRPLPAPNRARGIRRISRASSVRPDGVIWTPERLAAAEVPSTVSEEMNVQTPTYPDVPASVGDGAVIPMIEVLSVPPGARVHLDGTLLGLTPFARARPENFDTAQVELTLDGYQPVTGRLAEGPEGHLQFSVKLEPLPAD